MVSFLGINASRLEKLEERLKRDVVKEAKNMGGLILVHQELSEFFIDFTKFAQKSNQRKS
jgi:hypothetical protein